MKTVCIALAIVPLFAAAGELKHYRVQPAAGGHFTLEVTKTGFYSGRKHLLEFGRYEGKVRFDKDAPARSEVQFEVQAGDIVVRDTWVSESDRVKIHDHAVSDMLQAKSNPVIRFVSTAAEPTEGGLKVSGSLTIRGQSKPVTVFVKWKESNEGLEVEGESRFRMSIFGLKPPTAALGTIGTKDEMLLKFVVRAVRE